MKEKTKETAVKTVNRKSSQKDIENFFRRRNGKGTG